MTNVQVGANSINIEGKLERGKQAIIAVHGAGGGAWLWRRLRERLKDNFSVLAPDLPRHGKSTGDGESSVASYSETVRSAVLKLNISRPVLMGHSMGGAIAMMWALTHPDELAGLVLVSTGARLRVNPVIFKAIEENYHGYIRGLEKMAFGKNAPADIIEEAKVESEKASPQVTSGDFEACDKFDVMSDVSNIHVPALILCGEADLMTPLKYSKFLADNIPNAALKTFEGAGHMLPVEQPAEMARAIGEWWGNQ